MNSSQTSTNQEMKIMDTIQKIKYLPPGDFMFSHKIVGKDEISGEFYLEDDIIQVEFELGQNLGYQLAYRTRWIHHKRKWQFHLAQTYMMIERNFIPFKFMSLPTGEINIPRKSGKINIGKINWDEYNCCGLKGTKTEEGYNDDLNCYIPVVFVDPDNGMNYTKHISLTNLLQHNPDIKNFEVIFPKIPKSFQEGDFEGEYQVEIYQYFEEIYEEEWIEKIVKPIFQKVSEQTQIPIVVDIFSE